MTLNDDKRNALMALTALNDGSINDLEYAFWKGIFNGTILLKGDPGGIVAATLLPAGTDFNTITAPGTYAMSGTDVANAPNSPFPGKSYAINMIVIGRSSTVLNQILTVTSGGSDGMIKSRSLVSPSWSAWKLYASSRTDKTAGIATYQWDEIANREQLIYGDTGWRNLSAEIINGWAVGSEGGGVHIRRKGSTVTMLIRNLKSASATAGYFINALTVSGFAPAISGIAIPIVNTSAATLVSSRIILRKSERDFSIPVDIGTVGDAFRAASVSWETDDPWPTSLPGTAVGTIPNT